MTTAQLTDYVTHSEFKDFAHKSELAHEKISGDISNLRKDIEAQNTKIDAQNVKIDAQNTKIDAFTEKLDAQNVKIFSEIALLRKDIKNQNTKVDKEVSSAMRNQIIWLSTILIGFLGLFFFFR